MSARAGRLGFMPRTWSAGLLVLCPLLAVGAARAAPAKDAPALPERAVRPKIANLAGGPWVAQSVDRQHLLLYGLRGGVLHSPRKRPRKVAMSGRPYRIAIAPSGNRVAYVPEADGEPRVIDVATGAIAWQQPVGARFDRINLAFLDERTLVITTRCRALRVDLERPTTAPTLLGTPLCDEAAAPASLTGDDLRIGNALWYRRGLDYRTDRLLDAATGTEHLAPWLADADVVAAADGSIVCAGQRVQRQPDVQCARPGEAPRAVISGVPRGIALDPAGRRLAALIAIDDTRAEVVIADLASGATTRLGVTSDRGISVVGDDVVTCGNGEAGATVWRPAPGYRARLFAGREVEFALPTGTPGVMLVPTARGAGEDFHTVTFAPSR